MTRRHKILLIVALSALTLACFNFFSPSCTGADCAANVQHSTNSATPTPVPTASVVATPLPSGLLCRVDFLVFDSGATKLAVNERSTFSLTPWQRNETTGELVKVADSCNIPKAEFVTWKSSSVVGTVSKLPGGFAAEVVRVGIGDFTITASFEGRSVERTVQ